MGGTSYIETFRVEEGFLVRAVVPQRGRPYVHRCAKAELEQVAHAVDEAEGSFAAADLQTKTGLKCTPVNTAFAFLKERGIVVPVFNRRHKRCGDDAYIDAMTEYHALAWQAEHPGEPT